MFNFRKKYLLCFVMLFLAGRVTAELPADKMVKMLDQIKVGYINQKGNFIVEPQFDWGSDFQNGFATVYKGKAEQIKKRKAYLIDKNGTVISSPVPKKKVYVSFFENGIWSIFTYKKKGNEYGYMDSDGKVLLDPQFSSIHGFSEGLAAVKLQNKWGYINKQLEMVISPQFTGFSTGNFSEGLAIVEKEGKKGYINKKGEIIIDFQFTYAEDFSEGLAAVELNGKWGYIDKNGEFVIKPQYACAFSFSEGLGRVHIDENRNAYINRDGIIVIEHKFDYDADFHENLAAIRVGNAFNGKWGFMDKSGNVVIEPQFSCPESLGGPRFSEGLAVAGVKLYQYGYIDKTGKYVIPPIFRIAENFHEGIARVETFPKELREFYFKEWLKEK